MEGILMSKGRYCTYRVFKNYSKHRLRSTSREEYDEAVSEIVSKSTMKMLSVKPRGARVISKILLKNDEFEQINDDIKSRMDKATYISRINAETPKEITTGMLDAINNALALEQIS